MNLWSQIDFNHFHSIKIHKDYKPGSEDCLKRVEWEIFRPKFNFAVRSHSKLS